MKTSHEFKQCIEVQVKDRVRTLTVNVTLHLADVSHVEEYLDSSGKVYEDVCRIHHENKGDMIVYGSYSEIQAIVFPQDGQEKIGFRTNENIRPERRQSNSKRRSAKRT